MKWKNLGLGGPEHPAVPLEVGDRFKNHPPERVPRMLEREGLKLPFEPGVRSEGEERTPPAEFARGSRPEESPPSINDLCSKDFRIGSGTLGEEEQPRAPHEKAETELPTGERAMRVESPKLGSTEPLGTEPHEPPNGAPFEVLSDYCAKMTDHHNEMERRENVLVKAYLHQLHREEAPAEYRPLDHEMAAALESALTNGEGKVGNLDRDMRSRVERDYANYSSGVMPPADMRNLECDYRTHHFVREVIDKCLAENKDPDRIEFPTS